MLISVQFTAYEMLVHLNYVQGASSRGLGGLPLVSVTVPLLL